MTLLEMSVFYADSASRIRTRIGALRAEARASEDAETTRRLERRIAELIPLLRESRELAVLTARYYDRSYRKHEKYTI